MTDVSEIGFPLSRHSSSANSFSRRLRISAAFRRCPARASGSISDQTPDSNASWAAATARFMSSPVPSATRATGSFVAGLTLSNVPPPLESCHSLLMKCLSSFIACASLPGCRQFPPEIGTESNHLEMELAMQRSPGPFLPGPSLGRRRKVLPRGTPGASKAMRSPSPYRSRAC